MKRCVSLLLAFAVALLFFVQSDAVAKTEKQANAKLSPVYDGETYFQSKAPKKFQPKSMGNDDEAKGPRFNKWFVIEIDALGKRVDRFWHRVLPVIYKNYKFREVVD